jgi:hypothetical protein
MTDFGKQRKETAKERHAVCGVASSISFVFRSGLILSLFGFLFYFSKKGHLVPEEAYNCVNECTSKRCYDELYGQEKGGPLEDGEVDYERARLFTECVRKVLDWFAFIVKKNIYRMTTHNKKNNNNIDFNYIACYQHCKIFFHY